MKVGIFLFQNMRYAPFLLMYRNLFDSYPEVSYDIIYFNRDKSLKEIEDSHHYAIPWKGKGTLSASFSEKIISFFSYKSKAKKILKEKKYDYLIILTTFPAVLLSGYLSRRYKNKYIVDIRDYTYDNFFVYRFFERKAFNNAGLRIISSPGFTNFLPSNNYLLCHNMNDNASDSYLNYSFSPAHNRRIVISYIGTISYKQQCKELIHLVNNDTRFEFHFYGNEANGSEITNYVQSLNSDRIKFMGEFVPSDKPQIYAKSDLVFNCYGNDSALVKYAISNKFYDSALYKKPLLVSPGTSLASISRNFAYPLDLGKINDLNPLYEWYHSIDSDLYNEFSNSVIQHSIQDNNALKKSILTFLSLSS